MEIGKFKKSLITKYAILIDKPYYKPINSRDLIYRIPTCRRAKDHICIVWANLKTFKFVM